MIKVLFIYFMSPILQKKKKKLFYDYMTSKNKLFDEVDVLNGLKSLTKFYIRLNEY